MIRNFTAAEWDALVEAAALLEAEWEDESEYPRGARKRATLDRALTKAHQLAPEPKAGAR